MDYRNPLQHLLRNLLPSRGRQSTITSVPDFLDTRPDVERMAAAARPAAPQQQRQPAAWAESAIDLVQGTEIMEYPDETAADLMDEYFAKSEKRAA